MPRRMVITQQEAGIQYKFAIYPRESGDFGLIAHHENEARELLPKVIRPGDVALDIGAHHGLYTILLAYLVGEKGEVHAFDPHPGNIPCLTENIQLNNLKNVTINHMAVSNTSGTAQFNFGKSSNVSSLKVMSGQTGNEYEVKTVSVDDYVRRIGKPVQFIKIDVEGAEDLVLSGIDETLSIHRPVIELEFHQFNFEEEAAREMFAKLFDSYGYVGKIIFIIELGSVYRDIPEHAPFFSYDKMQKLAPNTYILGLLLLPKEKAENYQV